MEGHRERGGMKTSARGRKFICDFEGFSEHAYLCPAGVWTIGYGFTRHVREGDRITRAQADARLVCELLEYEMAVQAAAGALNQNQFDALVSFAWNVGVAGMRGSSVIKAHRRGDFAAAARAFGLWNRAAGKVMPGLTRRRLAEAALYLEPVPDDVSDGADEVAMPQAVDPERAMAASTINRASIAAGGTATVATVAQTINTLADVKRGADDLGVWLVPVLMVAVIGLCAYIAWERLKQRRGGWA